MRLTIEQKDLLGVVSHAARASKSSAVPIFTHLLLQWDESRLSVTGADFELWIRATTDCKAEGAGRCTILARHLQQVLATLPSGEVTLDVDLQGRKATLKAGRYKQEFTGYDPEEFPEIPEGQGGVVTLTPTPAEFKAAVGRVIFAIDERDPRPVLSGVGLLCREGILRVCGTNGAQLALSRVKVSEEASLNCLLSARAAREMAAACGDEAAACTLSFSKTVARLDTQDLTVVSRLMDGECRDMDTFLALRTPPQELTLEVSELRSAVERCALAAGDERRVILKVTPDSLQLSAQSPQFGRAEESLPVECQGEGSTIHLDGLWLRDGLRSLPGDTATLRFGGSLEMVLLEPPEDRSFAYALSPRKPEA
jgi:DNA polymerase-3 subunit beta